MPIRVQNYGPGDNLILGRNGWSEILNGGTGSDTAITGGGHNASVNADTIILKEFNAGNDRDPDAYYTESLPGLNNPYIGGHVLRNGTYMEFHEVHLAGMKDSGRISLANWDYTEDNPGEYRMMPGKVGGLFVIHGPGGDGSGSTWIRSFDTRPGAQQLSMAGNDIDVFRFTGITTKVANGYDLNVDTVWLVGDTDNPASDGQTVRMDDRYLSAAADFTTIHTTSNSASAQEAAVQAWVDRSSDGVGYDWLLLDG